MSERVFAVGDTVRIKSVDEIREIRGSNAEWTADDPGFVPEMHQYCGRSYVIQYINNYIHFSSDDEIDNTYSWSKNWMDYIEHAPPRKKKPKIEQPDNTSPWLE